VALFACALVAAGCGDDDDTARPEESTTATRRTADPAAATRTLSPPTSLSLQSTAETSGRTPAVLAAAVLYRTATAARSSHQRFNTFYVVERLGDADADGFITGLRRGPRVTGPERAAIEDALARRTVHWVASPQAVRGDDRTPKTIPERHAIISIAVPSIDGDHAEVATELWCGYSCGIGGISIIERDPHGTWSVTGESVFYVP
jgi:hypothetical protein